MNLYIIVSLVAVASIAGHKIETNLTDYEPVEMGSDDRTNATINSTTNGTCTNDYCISDDAYIDLIAESLVPRGWNLVLIGFHGAVFFTGIIGNLLVCIAVYRNRTMRNVTNYYIVNLAIADLMVIIFCLPSTVLWDVTETWFLGNALCKVIPYIQTVAVSVSILTLTFISIDRWWAICFPLRFKSNIKRTKRIILLIWMFSLIFDIPDLIVLHTAPAPHLNVETILYTQCTVFWDPTSDKTFAFIKVICLYGAPLIFMTFTYCSIIRVLWTSQIPGNYMSNKRSHIGESTATVQEAVDCRLDTRKKTAKMLIVIVLVFGLCYLPVHLLTILRQTIGLSSTPTTVACSLVAHWLCYANSAMNPVIYNFMSGKFRREFRRSFSCNRTSTNECGRKRYGTPYSSPVTRINQYELINVNTVSIQYQNEIVPLNFSPSRRDINFRGISHYDDVV